MRRLWLVFSQAVTIAVAVVFVLAALKPEWLQRRGSPVQLLVQNLPPLAGEGGAALASYAPAAQRAAPSVVSVVTQGSQEPSPHQNEPWYKNFGEPESGMGSAVIVSPDGYLLTNNHVIEAARKIEVVLADGQRVTAKLVGADPDTDLAVLKVALDGLPSITFGEVDRLQVGDVVLAIGNPFNVGQTVTSGIVSAVGRSGLGLNTYENFIQTDAAINPGNSGGALVDTQGQLMGINTAIYSRTGGSLGIGFAIPGSVARQVMDGLIRHGVVVRGWIGVQPADITREMATALKLPADGQGVLISGVLDGGPASTAGVRPGDVVRQVAGRPVASTAQLLAAVAALQPDTKASFALQREGRPLELAIRIRQRPPLRELNGDAPATPR